MNLLKKFIRDNSNIDEDEDNLYIDPAEDINVGIPEADTEAAVASLDSPERKDPKIQPASPDKVTIKLVKPRSHTEATVIADTLKEGSIVMLDISALDKDHALRLVDFLAGVAYVLGGEMIKTNAYTIVVAPSGVDISGFAAAVAEEEDDEEEEEETDGEEDYAEIPDVEEGVEEV